MQNGSLIRAERQPYSEDLMVKCDRLEQTGRKTIAETDRQSRRSTDTHILFNSLLSDVPSAFAPTPDLWVNCWGLRLQQLWTKN